MGQWSLKLLNDKIVKVGVEKTSLYNVGLNNN